ncbi:gliding motility protein GldM [Gaoshiqia sediminis]|uniref:Gliding motility protein GldM n=1 Tax=Gaoshiqia sediminis TaxID=2986998 RepID=A0AA42C719_9BACT|nr:gliding motility protein GldM [Gaoshiqia sediminis]MCW0483139.1 gliding motility protein GldM [Gaoshiqia sediminis]
MGTKNCPETPRQKMINMMYLVLLAMMALNVASEVLDAFRIVDTSLLQTLKSLDQKNDQLFASFNQAYELNQEKVKPWLDKANQVKSGVDSLLNKITDIKEEMVIRAGGTYIATIEDYKVSPDRSYITNTKGDTILIKKDDELNVPSEVMIRLKRATELKESISSLREELLALVEEEGPIRTSIIQDLDTSDPRSRLKEGGEKKTWESEHFENKPIIAVIALLSKIQIDIQNTETNILNYLYSQIDASSFKFNKLNAVVIPRSSYVLEGDVYHAKVFLAAEDTTQQPEIIVNNKSLRIEDGKGIFEVPASSAGTFNWSGLINFKTPEGAINTYRFEQEYQVGKPSVTISPTKMNVFYLNIPNPISVSVPGVPSENLSVSVTNGRIEKRPDGYLVYPTKEDINGKETKVVVNANINGVNRSMGQMVFRVKRVPDPLATIAEKNGGVLRKEDLMAEQGVFASLVDFDFDLKFVITQFDVTITGAGGYTNTWSSKSNRFTAEQKQQFGNLQPGSIIYFDNIVAHGDDNTNRELSPISFKIR